MDISKLQQQIAAEGWERYRASLPAGATKPTEAKTPEQVGPLEAKAIAQIAAVKRSRRADRVSSRGVHKLPAYRVGGRG